MRAQETMDGCRVHSLHLWYLGYSEAFIGGVESWARKSVMHVMDLGKLRGTIYLCLGLLANAVCLCGMCLGA